MPAAFIVTCEHAVHTVPSDLAPLFRGAEDILASHRGWDPGTLDAARVWAERLGAPLFTAQVSRLVCDANRNEGNPAVWSDYTRPLPRAERNRLLDHWHRPHRRAVRAELDRLLAEGRTVLHLAVHSFTPVLEGRVRSLDLGLLYDPARPGERALAAAWQKALHHAAPTLRVRRNMPYRGQADGLPTALRRLYPADRYLGFEIEFNQALLECGPFPVENVDRALQQVLEARPGPDA